MNSYLSALIGVVVLALSLITGARAQSCRVLDPELQESYEGRCVDGYAEGSGTAKGLAHYTGNFSRGLKHGYGIKIWPSGDRYEGEFRNDRKHGIGLYTWGGNGPAAGQLYKGSFLEDMRHGLGAYSWPTGEQYEGEWAKGEPLGPITHIPPSKSRAIQEALAAMAVPGTKLCREVTIGIAERELVVGSVVQSTPVGVQVRFDQPSRLIESLDGSPVRPGGLVWSPVLSWIPCQ